jgi:hypothetical protein
VTPRRIEVEVGTLVVEDPALARPGALGTALERELAHRLTRPAARASIGPTEERSVPELATGLVHDRSAGGVGAAIANALGQELAR